MISAACSSGLGWQSWLLQLTHVQKYVCQCFLYGMALAEGGRGGGRPGRNSAAKYTCTKMNTVDPSVIEGGGSRASKIIEIMIFDIKSTDF